MKIKEVSVEVKRSKHYQTSSVGMKASVEDGESYENAIKALQIKADLLAEEHLNKKIEGDKRT